ncbi:small integral membrane protein 24 [Parambassis ranga]|uniref:Small integral membrane protein 24 n=1 Tax=Parambassis ranga TaxID=210632 RepID=A0A6P7I7X5_9TELE|nr:small integral membrane protein 24 [Parambassis ranga]
MENLSALTSCLLLAVGVVMAQSALPQTSERLLPQWLTGLIAVSGFLFLAFVSFLVKKAWCEQSSRRRSSVEVAVSTTNQMDLDPIRRKNSKESARDMSNTYETSVDVLWSKDNMSAYSNLAADTAEDRATAM